MSKYERLAKGLAVTGSVLLFLSGAFHGAALPSISAALRASGLDSLLVRALRAIWEMAAWHWVSVGIIALVASFARTGPRRVLLALCGLIPLVDAIMGFAAVGFFIGDEMLTAAAVAILASAALMPSDGASLRRTASSG